MNDTYLKEAREVGTMEYRAGACLSGFDIRRTDVEVYERCNMSLKIFVGPVGHISTKRFSNLLFSCSSVWLGNILQGIAAAVDFTFRGVDVRLLGTIFSQIVTSAPQFTFLNVNLLSDI